MHRSRIFLFAIVQNNEYFIAIDLFAITVASNITHMHSHNPADDLQFNCTVSDAQLIIVYQLTFQKEFVSFLIWFCHHIWICFFPPIHSLCFLTTRTYSRLCHSQEKKTYIIQIYFVYVSVFSRGVCWPIFTSLVFPFVRIGLQSDNFLCLADSVRMYVSYHHILIHEFEKNLNENYLSTYEFVYCFFFVLRYVALSLCVCVSICWHFRFQLDFFFVFTLLLFEFVIKFSSLRWIVLLNIDTALVYVEYVLIIK